jgi:hypothetical protein
MLPIYFDNAASYCPSSSQRFQRDLQTEYVQCPPKEEVFANHAPSKNNVTRTDVCGVAKRSKWCEHSQSLGTDYTPGPFDVICARGKVAWHHTGNKRFRTLVKESTQDYGQAKNKTERSVILVSDILDVVHSKGRGFVKKEKDGGWIKVGTLLACEKAGQMLRNALSSKYRSSVVCKMKRRCREAQGKSIESLHGVMQSNRYVRQSMDTLKRAAIVKEETPGASISHEELMALFTQEQSNMLSRIKSDEDGLVDRFLQAEVTACLILNDDDQSADSDRDDIEMSII